MIQRKNVICSGFANQSVMCSMMDTHFYTDSANKIVIQEILSTLLGILAVAFILSVLIKKILSPLKGMQNALNSFFDFMNYKSSMYVFCLLNR